VRYRSTPAVALTETDLSSSSSSKIPAAGSVPVASSAPHASAAAAGNPFGVSVPSATPAHKSISSAETLGPRSS
jgi:hypothetical protein